MMARIASLSPPKAQATVILTALVTGWLAAWLPAPAPPPAPGADSSDGTAASPPAAAFQFYRGPAAIAAPLLARPLLTQGRRPVATTPVETATLPEPAPEVEPQVTLDLPPARPRVVLKGLMDTGGAARALLAWGEDAAEDWYAPGDDKDGWHIVAIGNQSVRIANETDEFTVNLFGE